MRTHTGTLFPEPSLLSCSCVVRWQATPAAVAWRSVSLRASSMHATTCLLLQLSCLLMGDWLQAHAFVCDAEWEQFGNKCYRLFERKMSYADAAEVCRRSHASGGSLATVRTKEEQAFVQQAFFPEDDEENQKIAVSAWIGGIRVSASNRNDAFRWLDGSRFNVTYWYPGEPNNVGTGQYCVGMWGGQRHRGMWFDQNCDQRFNPLCEHKLLLPTLHSTAGHMSAADSSGTDVALFGFEISDLYNKYHMAMDDRDSVLTSVHVLAAIAAILTIVMLTLFFVGDYTNLRSVYKNGAPFAFMRFDDSSIPVVRAS